MIAVQLPLDTRAMLQAQQPEKVALLTAWSECCNQKNPRSLRDEFERAIGRILLTYVLPVGN